ncbi:MAP7 domain-containing protein 1-like isoform X31 [Microplitis mediator]|uniref:MAP7 domain-containing protein 1-like isoform X31 n=1 Tax=Microplitis mediator TaxID=375433 RepID=UPI0025553E99|nr:MAP7 domain-containing protein 1-like isoform X31 [Microplitis mediator]
MFSELCRETLRKAAVCYSTGRTGSPTSSPPTSPPPSPAKKAKTIANIELANVNSTNDQVGESSVNLSKSSQQQYVQQGSNPSSVTDTREIANKKSNLEYVEKRAAMPTDFSRKSRRDRRRYYNSYPDEIRECRSVSCDRDQTYYYQNQNINNEYQRREYVRYRRDSSGSSTDQDDSSTSGDEAGAAPEESNQRSSSAHHRHSLTKEQTIHWFANIGHEEDSLSTSDSKRRSLYDEDSLDGDHENGKQGRESTGSLKDLDRAKLVRERQNEERQRKLEELKQQALSAQKFREQRDEERRRRIDELRLRDNDRRTQVEERKRMIWEAERERREAILRKNQEREARIEAKKKNEKSHIVFAFGSSTPRMLEPADTGGSSYWATRRATSTTNVMMFPTAQPLTRRSSERELDGSKKRATSAGGLDRKPGEDMRMSSSMYEVFNWNSSPDPCLTHAKNKRASLSLPPTTDIFAIDDKSDSDTRRATVQQAVSGEENDGPAGTPSAVYLRVNRRRTDLMPTIPSPRDTPPMSGRSSSAKAFTRSPDLSGELKSKDSKPPLPKVHSTPKKPSSSTPRASSTEKEIIKKPGDRLIKSARASPRITPKATPLQSPGAEQPSLIRQDTQEIIKTNDSFKEEQVVEHEISVIKSVEHEHEEEKKDQGNEKCLDAGAMTNNSNNKINETIQAQQIMSASAAGNPAQKIVKYEPSIAANISVKEEKKDEVGDKKNPPESSHGKSGADDNEEVVDMSASMIAKIRITTEDEAKAALAERRRLAREQAEREAELERQRLEEEARLEEERLRAEEEEQRRLEEETIRLANEARLAEEQRLQQAIEDATRREEEERKRREEEARQKLEKEEADRKSREEAEKQRLEMVERLKKEEEERIARRKRVEAIMKRTRGGNNQANTPTKDGDKSKDDSPNEESKPVPGNKVDDVMTASLISEATQQFITSEQQDLRSGNNSPTTPDNIVRNGTHSNGINNSNNKTATLLENNQGNVEELNGHHTNNHGNGINTQITLDNATVKQNNVTNNLLDFSEFDTLSNNTSGTIFDLSSNISNEDTLNSNLNPTAMPFTPMVVNPFVPVNTNNANTNPFQDAFTNNKSQDNNQLPDLLS